MVATEVVARHHLESRVRQLPDQGRKSAPKALPLPAPKLESTELFKCTCDAPGIPMTHDFDAAIQLEALGGHRYGGATSPAYANMVGPFGGITSAVLLNATLLHPERQGEPIALTVNFAGPVADGP
jgi:hypothetical protein